MLSNIIKTAIVYILILGLGIWGWSNTTADNKDGIFIAYFAISLLQIAYLTIKITTLEQKTNNKTTAE